MNIRIFYEYWQMCYFNKPFKTGDLVEWYVVADFKDCPSNVGHIDYLFKAHSEKVDGLFLIKGVVKDVSVVFEKYETIRDGENYRNIIYPEIIENVKTDTSVFSEEEQYKRGFMAKGYVVELDVFNVCMAESAMEKEEVLSKTKNILDKAIPGSFERNKERISDILNMNDKFCNGLMKIDFIGEQAAIFFCERGKLDYSYHTDKEDIVIFAFLDYLIDLEVRDALMGKSDVIEWNSIKKLIAEYVTDEEKCKNAAEHRKEIENNKKRLIDEAFERAGDPYNMWHKDNLNWTKLKSII